LSAKAGIFISMALSKQQKKKVIEKIKQELDKQKSIFFIDFQKLKASQLFDLRKKIKQTDALLYIAKKNLINIAFQDKKIPVKIKELAGQIGIVFSFEDEIAPAKIIHEFQKKYKSPEILGGFYEKKFINQEKAIELAKLPSKQELLARLVGALNAPSSKFANVLQSNIKGLIFILKQAKT